MATARMTSLSLTRTIVPRLAARATSSPSLLQRGIHSSAVLPISSVESRLQADHVRAVFRSMAMQDDDVRNDMSYSLAFADDEEEGAWQFSVLSDPRMMSQLEKSRNQCIPSTMTKATTTRVQNHDPHAVVDHEPLPKNMSDALRPSRRAIVITENKAPFRIWNVNPAWEKLCGYSFLESRGKTLGSLLQGKETDTVAATNLIAKLLQGEEEVGTTLVNYSKDGRRFRNRVRVGPIYDDQHNVTHFVGVLQEINA